MTVGLQVVWPAVSVADKRDPKNVKDGIVVKRGDMLPDWVDDFTIHVLTTTGAVKSVEEPDKFLMETEKPPAPVLLQEHDAHALGIVREDVKGTSQDPAFKGGSVKADDKSQQKSGGPTKNTDPNRPADSASKSEWLTYARSVEKDTVKKANLTDEKTTRAELISTYG